MDPDNKDKILQVNGVFLFLKGNKPSVEFLSGSLKLAESGCIAVDKDTMTTNIEGVYAIGDVTCTKTRQVVIAAAEGSKAALSVDKFLNQRNRIKYQWQ